MRCGPRLALLALVALLALPALAQSEPTTPPQSPPTQQPPPPAGTPQPPPPAQQAVVQPPPAPKPSKWFFGGGIGASFGDVQYIEIAPMVGYRVHPRFTTGVGAFWRSRDDKRYSPSISTDDYGGSVFGEFYLTRAIFAHVEYEYTNWEYPVSSGGTTRSSSSNYFVGAGFFKPLGGNVGFYASALYNLSYESNDLTSPYDSPWVYRFGVSVGF